jgi:demethylmenaquinone methyltransferase/2-methoxy-6-polyprenyl-1,4-benzoquinol methylase
MAVVNAMVQRPGAAAAAIVGGVLADKAATPELRREAAGTLARMKTKEADVELLKHAADPDKQIKAAVSSRAPAKPARAKPGAAKPATKKSAATKPAPAKPAPAKAKTTATPKAKPAAR